MISLIAAYGKDREIGLNNNLLWHIPADLKNFVKYTKGKPIIVGRKTFESFKSPLPGREHLVLTTNKDYKYDHKQVKIFNSVQDIMSYIEEKSFPEVVVCGGAKIYDLFFPFCDLLYLSEIEWSGEADTYFTNYDLANFEVSDQKVYEETEKTPKWTFKIYKKHS